MGLTLFPGDGDVSSPDAGWSYRGFHDFRHALAQAEGFDLEEMRGFGGVRLWSEVTTVLEPLLDHPDVVGDPLSTSDCAAMWPRLEAIADEWAKGDTDGLRHRHIEDARQLALVLRLCAEKGVPLLFG
ncbi:MULTISPECIES: hypothetical protein [Streptomyces]|uniref:hypothetical protein n=1 Tax=Streptomyces TaxID=1883 RepID=UPI000F77EA15|nr:MULTISPECIES: hypothetical protein [Streptomyces]RSS98552.1 hypothetical protein EF910_38820 [Streptomyces sp. WAC07149]GLX24162.1 hypothetical protein Slala01_78060 [Streptomyces lavendulae subsp. lavendulae]GLX32009.1 hypothetical protein Slala02_78280 [Streptomyces lavendulae subsp. lavendulae]